MKLRRIVTLVLAFAMLSIMICGALAEEHYYGYWHFRRNNLHKALCLSCKYPMYVECGQMSCTYEGAELKVCPVCGHFGDRDGYHIRSEWLLYDYSNSPVGDLLLMKYSKPFGDDSDIAYAFTVIFEYAGKATGFDGTINLNFKFNCPESFTLLRADGDELSEIEYTYDAERGRLSFICEHGSGMFLMKTR